MSKEIGRYDSSLQMFVQKPRDADINHLRFHRWLAERGARTLSAPRGAYLFQLTDHEIVEHIAKQTREEKLRAHIQATGGY